MQRQPTIRVQEILTLSLQYHYIISSQSNRNSHNSTASNLCNLDETKQKSDPKPVVTWDTGNLIFAPTVSEWVSDCSSEVPVISGSLFSDLPPYQTSRLLTGELSWAEIIKSQSGVQTAARSVRWEWLGESLVRLPDQSKLANIIIAVLLCKFSWHRSYKLSGWRWEWDWYR